jgi:cellulose synthase/poly-beta-1,6-N-acetylglucosamine synthase-like glycosyltransferase
MIIIILSITLLYVALIGSFIYGFDKVATFQFKETPKKIKFSVIIPFRNEAENLHELLSTISKLKYPTSDFEIIFVNDESNDSSVEIIKNNLDKTEIDFSMLQNKRVSKSPKKDAISTAIETAKHGWIITTDADCVLPDLWLDCFNSFINQNKCNMLVGPVAYYKINTFLDRFQAFDFLSLIGATIGGFGLKNPFLSNGANLAYKKDFFKALNGFDGNTDIASGDDVFLLQKAIERNRDSVLFLKATEAIVLTKPQPDFESLKSQRVRWASKTTHYKNNFGKLTGLLVLLMNAILISSLILTIIGSLKLQVFIIILVAKLLIDFILLCKTATFYNQKQLLKSYLLCALFYPFFSVYIASLSLFLSYKWKGRDFKR